MKACHQPVTPLQQRAREKNWNFFQARSLKGQAIYLYMHDFLTKKEFWTINKTITVAIKRNKL